MTHYKNGSPIGDNSAKIDDEVTLGLSGTANSLAYRTEENEKHVHNNEKWFGAAAVAAAETHNADRMGPAIAPFALVSGNDDFGSWVQILGSSDTPVMAGQAKYDLHSFLITTTDSTAAFLIQIIDGESADFAAKLAAETYTEFPYEASTNNNDGGVAHILNHRSDSTCKVWARCICIGQNAKTINFYFGLHEYVG